MTDHSSQRPPALVLLVAMLMCACLAPPAARAQTLAGLVLDQARGTPIPLARVTLSGEDSVPVAATLTDIRGRFIVTAPESGSYWVDAASAFYQNHFDGPVSLTAGDTAAVAFHLTPYPVEIEGLLVEAGRRYRRMLQGGYYDRAEAGYGWQLDRARIEETAKFRISEALRSIPVLSVARTRFGDFEPVFEGWRSRLSGRQATAACYPRVFIDGILFSPGGDMPTELDRALNPEDVEAIEVFQSPWVPAQFDQGLARCGVIAVWRR